jgi:hypothetical protein
LREQKLSGSETGIELVHMLRKEQLEGGREQELSVAEQFASLAS